MKTIFIMLSRGIVARNILRSDTFKILKNTPNLRMVIFVPLGMPEYFRKEFESDNVVFEETPEVEYSLFRKKFFTQIIQKTVYTKTARFMMFNGGRGTKQNKNILLAILGHCGSVVLSRFPIAKKIFWYLELKLFPDKDFDKYFEKYKPDLVFSTIIKAKRDIAILKSAKRFGVFNISMSRSWDNLDRILIAVRPDKLLVQNEIMKKLAVKLHGMQAEDVEVVGFPQFDIYQSASTFEERDKFILELGLDPSKKIIMFASEGVWAPYGHLIAKMLKEMVEKNEFSKSCNLIVRPHFSDMQQNNYAELFRGQPGVYLDEHMRAMDFFVDKWDASYEEMRHLANELKHADVLVTFATTLSIEASILDTPVVNVAFKAPEEPKKSGPWFGLFYRSSHYSNVVRSGAVRLVYSREELKNAINEYFAHPEKQKDERRQCAELLSFKTDGKSGERVANFILMCLNNKLTNRI